MPRLLIALSAVSLLAMPVLAAPCKDPKTKRFMKCPAPAAKAAARCRKGGKFAKCGTPGATPA